MNDVQNPFETEIGNLKHNPLYENNNNNNNNNNGSNELEQVKNSNINYNIIDLYWVPNLKIIYDMRNKLTKYEPHMINIGYNADFDNLRIIFYNFNDSKLISDYYVNINRHNLTKITSFNIHSEFAEHFLYFIGDENRKLDTLKLQERIVSQTMDNFKPNKTDLKVYNNKNKIDIMTIDNSNNKYYYSFIIWQYDILIKSLRFLISDNARQLSMMTKFNK